jgi:hypothetical protein
VTAVLRSSHDLRALREPNGPTYLRRVDDMLEIRCGKAVRRVPLYGPGSAHELVTYEYEHVPSRGASYRRYGLLVRDGKGRALANIDTPMTPQWDPDEVRRFAKGWGLRATDVDLVVESRFIETYGKLGKADLHTRASTAFGCLMAIGMLVATLGGAGLGLLGMNALADKLGLAARPGVGAALFVPGVAIGGVGCLFLMFAGLDLVRGGVAAVRARTAHDGALRPSPRHGAVRLVVERDELVAYAPDNMRLVLPWSPDGGVERPVGTLRRYRLSTSDDAVGEAGLLVLDSRGVTVLALRCPFDQVEVSEFGARLGLTVADELISSPGAHEMRLATLDPRAKVTVTRSTGFFTVTVGATLLGALAYTPAVVCLVLLLGLVLPAGIMSLVGIVAAILPAPLLGPVTYRHLQRWRSARAAKATG